MGLLINGAWHAETPLVATKDGAFVRNESPFRNWVTADGAPGPTGEGGFQAEHGRYHLYVSLACPWAHRTLIYRALNGLRDSISVSVVNWLMLDQGWTFAEGGGGGPRPHPQRPLPARDLHHGRPALHRQGDGARAVGQGARHHREQ